MPDELRERCIEELPHEQHHFVVQAMPPPLKQPCESARRMTPN
jgi:hypothetical protein